MIEKKKIKRIETSQTLAKGNVYALSRYFPLLHFLIFIWNLYLSTTSSQTLVKGNVYSILIDIFLSFTFSSFISTRSF